MRWHQGQLLFEGNRHGAVFTVILLPFGGRPSQTFDSVRNHDGR